MVNNIIGGIKETFERYLCLVGPFIFMLGAFWIVGSPGTMMVWGLIITFVGILLRLNFEKRLKLTKTNKENKKDGK